MGVILALVVDVDDETITKRLSHTYCSPVPGPVIEGRHVEHFIPDKQRHVPSRGADATTDSGPISHDPQLPQSGCTNHRDESIAIRHGESSACECGRHGKDWRMCVARGTRHGAKGQIVVRRCDNQDLSDADVPLGSYDIDRWVG